MNKKTKKNLFWYKIFLTIMVLLQLYPVMIGVKDVIILGINFISGFYFMLRFYLLDKLGRVVNNKKLTLKDIINMRNR